MKQITTHQRKTHTRQAKRRRRTVDTATLIASIGALFVLIPFGLLSLLIISFQVFQLNLPGVYILDQAVGLTSLDETTALVQETWNKDRLINLIDPNNPAMHFIVSPADLGLWVDPDATAQGAYNIGRDSAPFSGLISAASGYQQIILPVLYLNEEIARQTLTEISQQVEIKPVNARLAYQNGDWVVEPSSDGLILDIDTVLEGLSSHTTKVLLTGSIDLHTRPVSPEITDLSLVLSEIETVVAENLHISAYDPITDEHLTLYIPQEIKREWVTVDPETNIVQLTYREDDIQKLVETWQNELGQGRTFIMPENFDPLINAWDQRQPYLAIIQHPATVYEVSRGESLWSISLKLGIPLWHILEANEGLTTSNLEFGMSITIPSKNDLLPLPVIPEKRIVIDISTQRMTVYENGQVRSTHIISTGVEDSPTMAGVFQIQSHSLNAYASNWDLYMPHFMGIYEAWPGFMNGIHGLPTLSNGQRLWAGNLGRPVSYGCIILGLAEAEALYDWAEPGVVVEITP